MTTRGAFVSGRSTGISAYKHKDTILETRPTSRQVYSFTHKKISPRIKWSAHVWYDIFPQIFSENLHMYYSQDNLVYKPQLIYNLANSATVGKPQESKWVGSLCLSPHLQWWTDKRRSVVLPNRMRPMAKKKVNRKWDEAHIVEYTHTASRVKLWGTDYSGPFLMRLERRVWTLPMTSVTFKYSTAVEKFHDQRVLRLHLLKTKIMS